MGLERGGCLVLLWLGAACAPAAPVRGELLSPGVAQATFETRARHTDLVRVQVLFPADDSGRPAVAGTAGPGVVFIQGGAVPVARYRWQAEVLARAGFTVAMPEHALNLAFFEIENGLAALELLRSGPKGSLLDGRVDPDSIALAGHSLGGVVAAKVALAGDAAALVLEASYPDGADVQRLSRWERPSLSLAGRLDCSAKLEQTSEGAALLRSPTAFVVLDGVTHYQFTDSQREDVERGCLPELPLEEAHARVGQALVTFLSASLRGEGVDAEGLDALPGAEVTVR